MIVAYVSLTGAMIYREVLFLIPGILGVGALLPATWPTPQHCIHDTTGNLKNL
jgi:hypothetical protein